MDGCAGFSLPQPASNTPSSTQGLTWKDMIVSGTRETTVILPGMPNR
jgi:hypothetical protein